MLEMLADRCYFRHGCKSPFQGIGFSSSGQNQLTPSFLLHNRNYITLVQTKLEQSPFSGHVFVFRGRRGDLIKVLWYDGDGLCLFAKRLERGRFVWPQAVSGTVSLTRAQLSMLLEGIDWRRPERTWEPQLSV
jgi:transposase